MLASCFYKCKLSLREEGLLCMTLAGIWGVSWAERVHASRADSGEHFSTPPFPSSQWTVLNELYLCQLQGFEAECDYSGYQ